MEFIKVEPASLNSEALQKVLSQNIRIAKEMRREIVASSSLQEAHYEPTDYMRKPELEETPEIDRTDQDFEDDISIYLLELAHLPKPATKEDLLVFLPDKSSAKYELVINRLIIELLKNNATIRNFAEDSEELAVFAEDIATNNQQISLLRELMSEEELDLTEISSTNHLIFVPTSTGYPFC